MNYLPDSQPPECSEARIIPPRSPQAAAPSTLFCSIERLCSQQPVRLKLCQSGAVIQVRSKSNVETEKIISKNPRTNGFPCSTNPSA
jgi:hypothetical protein